MNRRELLSLCGGLAASAALWRPVWAADLPRDLKITRIVAFDLVSRRPKVVGKNSQRGDHGDRAMDRMVRLYTSAGLEGLGNCRADEKANPLPMLMVGHNRPRNAIQRCLMYAGKSSHFDSRKGHKCVRLPKRVGNISAFQQTSVRTANSEQLFEAEFS